MPPPNSNPPPGILAALVTAFADPITQHLNLPPGKEKAVSRGCYGAALLVLAAYGVLFAEPLTGKSASGLMTAFLRAPRDVWLPLAAWTATAFLGGAWLISGVHGAAVGPRRGFAAFWAAVRIALWASAMLWAMRAPADWLGWVALLDLLLLVFIAGDLTRFCLELRGGGKALRRVNRQIQQTRVVMRPATGRRHWWQFWK